MPYRRHHSDRRRILWVAGAVVLVVIGLVFVVVRSRPHDDGAARESEVGADRSTRATDLPHDRDRDRDRRQRRGEKADQDDAADPPGWLAGAPTTTGTLDDGPHRAVLTATTAQGELIGVKYAFRTGNGYRDGQTTSSTGSWSAAETVRGHEPLAGLIAQVVSGTVTCTASIDGRVVYRTSSSGRFATVVCAA